MPLAIHTVPSGSGAGDCPPGVFLSGASYEPGASAFGVIPLPRHIAATRSRSVSNAAQSPSPRFSTSARGVRLVAGSPPPACPASRTDEKNGKSGSTQGTADGAGGRAACCRAEPDVTKHSAATSARAVR